MVVSKIFDWCGEYNIQKVVVDIGNDESFITIYDSSKIRKVSHMKEVLDWLKSIELTNKILQRSEYLLLAEWKGHNILYDLNFKPTHTEHVDFDIKISSIELLAYIVISLFYKGK